MKKTLVILTLSIVISSSSYAQVPQAAAVAASEAAAAVIMASGGNTAALTSTLGQAGLLGAGYAAMNADQINDALQKLEPSKAEQALKLIANSFPTYVSKSALSTETYSQVQAALNHKATTTSGSVKNPFTAQTTTGFTFKGPVSTQSIAEAELKAAISTVTDPAMQAALETILANATEFYKVTGTSIIDHSSCAAQVAEGKLSLTALKNAATVTTNMVQYAPTIKSAAVKTADGNCAIKVGATYFLYNVRDVLGFNQYAEASSSAAYLSTSCGIGNPSYAGEYQGKYSSFSSHPTSCN